MLFASARRSHDAWIWRPERRLGFHSDASRIPIVTTVKRNETTRLALMRAAERLFAERGVEAVSLREIATAAGQRNNSSALYHFGDKRELIEAMLSRHSDPINEALPGQLAKLREEG
jgi:AcrR family transcriptional regulator